MRIVPSLSLLLALALTAAGVQAMEPEIKSDHIVAYKTEGDFEMVREDIELAIEGRGLVINNESHIAEMLERTGGDIGDVEDLYEHGRALEFCSAELSRDMMAADPHNIMFCPYIIAVYELTDEPGQIYVGYRRLAPVAEHHRAGGDHHADGDHHGGDGRGGEASAESLEAVEELLDDLVQEALAF